MVKIFTPMTALNWETMQTKAKKVIRKTKVPLFMITAEHDTSVSNKVI